jgi:uncharacterized membrane protein HdeD (DUF308 family)
MIIIAGNWWTFLLRGIAAIIFGLIAFFVPGIALLSLVLVYGVYALVDGIFGVVAAFRKTDGERNPPWWALLIYGLLGIAAGIITLALPAITAFVLIYVIAGWALATGIASFIAAIRLRRHVRGEWMLALNGIFSILFGVAIAIFPGAGALALALWIGAYSFVQGVLLIALGIKLRKTFHELRAEHYDHGMPMPAH